MKNYLSFGIMLLSLVVSSSLMAEMFKQDFENITAAMEEADAETVEGLLKFYTPNEQQKKELLKKALLLEEAMESTALIFAKEKNNKNFLARLGDETEITLGAILTASGTIIGTITAAASLNQTSKLHEKFFFATFGFVSGLLTFQGMYLIIKRWNCSMIEEIVGKLYNNVQKIKELIEKTIASKDKAL